MARPAEHRIGGRLGRIRGEGDGAPGLGAGCAQRDLGEGGADRLPGRDLEVAADQDGDEEAAQHGRFVVELGGDEVDEHRRALRVADQDHRMALGMGKEPLPGGQHAVISDSKGRAHDRLVPARPFSTLGKVWERYAGAHTSQTRDNGAACSSAVTVSTLVTARAVLPVPVTLSVG